MRLRAFFGAALAGLLATTAYSGEPPATAESVVEKFVAAIGGEKAILALETRTCEGTLTHDLRSREKPVYAEIPFECFAKIPNLKLFVEHAPDGHTREGFDGTHGWRERNGEVTEADDAGLSKMSWLLNPQNALRIEEYFPNLKNTGIQEIRGHRCYALVPEGRDPLYYTLYFDTETDLLFSLGYYWEFDDWRDVDGVLFPHKIVTDRKGGSSTYEFSKVTHNDDVEDSVFARP